MLPQHAHGGTAVLVVLALLLGLALGVAGALAFLLIAGAWAP